MNESLIGFVFLLCLLMGVAIGFLFHSMEIGGVIGLGLGLLFILLFRKRRRGS